MDRSLPRIGVVVLNWNGLTHLRTCLPSVLASSYPDFFVVMTDNGSEDGSVEWTRRELQRAGSGGAVAG